MAALVADRVLDNGLSVLDSEADKIYICSTEPTTYTEATSTYALGNKNFGAGGVCGSPAAGTSPTGRKVTTTAVTDGSVTADGTAAKWAIVDSANSRLLARGNLSSSVGVTNGSQFTLGAFDIKLASG